MAVERLKRRPQESDWALARGLRRQAAALAMPKPRKRNAALREVKPRELRATRRIPRSEERRPLSAAKSGSASWGRPTPSRVRPCGVCGYSTSCNLRKSRVWLDPCHLQCGKWRTRDAVTGRETRRLRKGQPRSPFHEQLWCSLLGC